MAFSKPNDLAAEGQPSDADSPASNVPGLTESISQQPGSLEFSAPLENSVSLEAPRQSARVPIKQAIADPLAHQSVPQPIVQQPEAEKLNALQKPFALEHSNFNTVAPPIARVIGPQSNVSLQATEEAIIPLLEERLVVDRHRRKVGEVVVRKEIETYIVEVPMRREKLIVEQISPTYKQLAVVDLGKAQMPQDDLLGASLSQTASAKFNSANAAIEFIEAIAADSNSNMAAIQVSIVLVDENLQTAYQQWLEQHSKAI